MAEATTLRFDAGTEFLDPETGQGYRLIEPLEYGEVLAAAMVEPINGAQRPETGEILPLWLCKQLGIA